MKIKDLHNWNLSYSQAREVQVRLAGRLEFVPLKEDPKVVAGLDCAFSRDGQRILAAVVVLRLPDFELVETVSAVRKVKFSYIPGLLSFREAPVCIAAAEKLRSPPDVFMIDGQGIAHPRRLGLAAHLGLFFDMPTVGCAKSRLTGEYEEPPLAKGAHTPLTDKSEIIGAVVRTRTNIKPVFVSDKNRSRLRGQVSSARADPTCPPGGEQAEA
ncbi:MAG: endonuclease V [Planctomycetota bacterium]|jgi:deoxyribonuclease V